VRELGRGGMGVVYLAEQQNPSRLVALKVIAAGLTVGDALRRFEHEAQVLARLKHPGIAQVFEAGTGDTGDGVRPYFVMELIEGQSLTDYARARALPTRQRLELFVKVCAAVQHAHQKGVIHRDLKPGNILVDEAGRPRVLDFGVARLTGPGPGDTHATAVGQLVGTLPYMSPEQVAADPDALDTRSDVYTLGVILYQLLTGRLPYEVAGKPAREAARVITEREPARLGSVDKALRGDLETVVARALEKDRERRYSSADALADDVERYLRGDPILARPASALYQLKKF